MTRIRLPDRRPGVSFGVVHDGQHYTVTIGYSRPLSELPNEVFLNAHKLSSAVEAVARDGAILISLALQHGAPLAELRQAVTRDEDGGPTTMLGAALDAIGERS